MKNTSSKSFSRYKKWIIVWIIFIILFSLMVIVNSFILPPFNIYTILTQNLWLDSLILFLSIPIVSIIAFMVGGYILTPLLLIIHKKILGRNLLYGINEIQKPKIFKGAFIRSLFPALLALNIGILLSDQSAIHDLIFTNSFQTIPTVILQILTIVILLPLVSGLAIAAFSAAFFLIDSGIEYTNKAQKKVKRGSFPIEVRSMGGYYLYYLKGYAGISVIISIIKLIFSYLSTLQVLEFGIFLMNLIVWPIMPFTITFFLVPVAIIEDFTYERRKNYTLKWAEKLNIKGILEDPLGRSQK